MKELIVIFALSLSQQPKTVELINIFNKTIDVVDSVNMVIETNGNYYVTRNGDLHKVFPTNTYRLIEE